MAVPVRVTSAMGSRRPAVAGQSRARTRICRPVITTPSPPGRLASGSSRRLASCRDWLASSVQPATSTLPDHRRAWPGCPRSSCRDPIEMPGARPPGTRPGCNQRGDILPADIAGEEFPPPVRGTRRANRGAGGRAIQSAAGSGPPGQPRRTPARRLKARATNGGEPRTGQRGLPRAAGPGARSPGHGPGGQFPAHAPSPGAFPPRYRAGVPGQRPIRTRPAPAPDVTTSRESHHSGAHTPDRYGRLPTVAW